MMEKLTPTNGLYLEEDSSPTSSVLEDSPNVIDGTLYTQAEDYWDQYDSYGINLGVPADVSYLRCYCEVDEGKTPTGEWYVPESGHGDFAVYSSDDNSSWSHVDDFLDVTIENIGAGQLSFDVEFSSPVTAQYFKITALSIYPLPQTEPWGDPVYISCGEIEAYGEASEEEVPKVSGNRALYPMFQAFDKNGNPLSAGKLYTYYAGTDVAKPLYMDALLTVEATNPVILNSRGEAEVFADGLYKAVLKSSTNRLIWTVDNWSGGGGGGSGTVNSLNLSDFGCDLQAAIDYISSDEAELYIDCDCAIDADAVSPFNMTIIPLRSNLFTIATGKKLTIGNMRDPGLFQIFAGAGTVEFGQNACDFIRSEWWGALGNATGQTGVGEDDTSAVESALTCSFASKIPLYVPKSSLYRITTEISLDTPSWLSIVGEGLRWTVKSTDNYLVRGGFFKDFVSTANESMLDFSGTTTALRAKSMNINGVNFCGIAGGSDDDGQLLKISYADETSLAHCNFIDYKGCGLLLDQCWDTNLESCRSARCGDATNGRYAIEMIDSIDVGVASNHLHMINCRLESSPHGELGIIGQATTGDEINDIWIHQCKFHGPSSHTGPNVYLEEVDKVQMFQNAFINSKNKGIHVKNGNHVWINGLKIQGCYDENIYVEGDSHVYVDNGLVLGPNDLDSHVSSTVSSDGTSTFQDLNATFVTDGVLDTMIIRVTGFTEDANNGYFSIASVTETTIVIDQTSLAVEAAGDAITIQFFLPHFAVVDADSHLYVGPNVETYQFYENVAGGMIPPYYGDGVFRQFYNNENAFQVLNNKIQSTIEDAAGPKAAGYFGGRLYDSNSGSVDAHDRVRIRSTLISWGDGTEEPDTALERGGADLLRVASGDDFKIAGYDNGTPADSGFLRVGDPGGGTDWYIWVSDAGKLMIKSGAPSSDTDGTIVGTQTA